MVVTVAVNQDATNEACDRISWSMRKKNVISMFGNVDFMHCQIRFFPFQGRQHAYEVLLEERTMKC